MLHLYFFKLLFEVKKSIFVFQQSPDDAQLVYLKMPSSQPSSPLPENEEFLGKLRRRYLLDSTSEALSPETMGPESNSNQPSLHYLSNNVSYAFMAADSNGNSMAQQMLVLISADDSVLHNLIISFTKVG